MIGKVIIRAGCSISAVGKRFACAETSFNSQGMQLSFDAKERTWQGALSQALHMEIEKLRDSKCSQYASLDRSTLFAIYTAREALKNSKIAKPQDTKTLVSFGSSRGATSIIEASMSDHFTGKQLSSKTSPTTTLGNVSSWVTQDLGITGAALSHSMTCSSALQAIGNAIAWLSSGMIDRALVGGTEAPLTPYTHAQMSALRITTEPVEQQYPCRPFCNASERKNTMVLGEGAGCFVLERSFDLKEGAAISGLGFACEKVTSHTSMSKNADALQHSMKQACLTGTTL